MMIPMMTSTSSPGWCSAWSRFSPRRIRPAAWPASSCSSSRSWSPKAAAMSCPANCRPGCGRQAPGERQDGETGRSARRSDTERQGSGGGRPEVRALYVSPMPYGANAAVDAICHGLESRLAENGVELRVAYANFADPGWRAEADQAVRGGADAGFDAIVIWVTDPATLADAVGYARGRGVPVVSFERPRFAVDASVVYPNFNQGTSMAEYLATLLPAGGGVAVVGGPDVVDDIELLLGIVHGLATAGLTRSTIRRTPATRTPPTWPPAARRRRPTCWPTSATWTAWSRSTTRRCSALSG